MGEINEIAGSAWSDTDSLSTALQASREKTTGHGIFPRVPDTSPSADRYEPILLSPEAILYSFTVIHPNPKTGQQPFTLIYADFPESTRVFGRLVLRAGERPQIGAAVQVVRTDGSTNAADYHFELVQGE